MHWQFTRIKLKLRGKVGSSGFNYREVSCISLAELIKVLRSNGSSYPNENYLRRKTSLYNLFEIWDRFLTSLKQNSISFHRVIWLKLGKTAKWVGDYQIKKSSSEYQHKKNWNNTKCFLATEFDPHLRSNSSGLEPVSSVTRILNFNQKQTPLQLFS